MLQVSTRSVYMSMDIIKLPLAQCPILYRLVAPAERHSVMSSDLIRPNATRLWFAADSQYVPYAPFSFACFIHYDPPTRMLLTGIC
jgi:hypothetical protein